jgi:Flp pilus assembly protein TadD
VTRHLFGQPGLCLVICVVAVMASLMLAQAPSQADRRSSTLLGTIQGYVRDFRGRPIVNVTVSLLPAAGSETHTVPPQVTRTDSEGAFRFAALQAGTYSLRADMIGYDAAAVSPVNLATHETKNTDLVLVSRKALERQNVPLASPKAPVDTKAPEFYDEPHFTVAGVTQATNAGGHGSDTVLRTSEALAQATVSLGHDLNNDPNKGASKNDPHKNEASNGPSQNPAGSLSTTAAATTETSLRDAVKRDPKDVDANRRLGMLLADIGELAGAVPFLEQASRLNPKDSALHRLLGEVEEKLGKPLQAVQEFQLAAELDPNEPNLFDWGTELLAHRALEPATEVFTKGNRLFPQSVRVLVALGVSLYARGSYDQAAHDLAHASDLDPGNPVPYLFLGRMQSAETAPLPGVVERLERFVQLQPENPLANYYCAVALWKQSLVAADTEPDTRHGDQRDKEVSPRVESLLQKAARLDPKLASAYLQLGILYSQRGDFVRAISEYQKAIEVGPEEASPHLANSQIAYTKSEETLEEVHYRLAQTYLRIGEKAKAQEQLQLHEKLSEKTRQDNEQERHETQEFVISLRNKDSVPQ